ncbi:MAG: NYN domain-containing protein [Firmicutes bacterium]|nr:NYN domain-containing protein [Bacillota bacterium]MCL1954039.1 NYN domain-containing protein [Bacillota bacterium]
MEIKDRTIALLIDSDNMSREYYAVLLDELSRFGRVTYRRLYGDFTRPKQNGWRDVLLENSIEQRQQTNYTKGKNSTDSSMIIDAMDILYGGKVDCFCLATSDSDFTGLAMRFRNDNLIVIGAGEKKTPQAFRKACDRFIAVDELLLINSPKKVVQSLDKSTNSKSKKKQQKNTQVLSTISTTTFQESEQPIVDIVPKFAAKHEILEYAYYLLQERADDSGWMFFSAFVDGIYRKYNDFNPKLYGQNNGHVATFFKAQVQDNKPIFEFANVNNILKIKKLDN